MSKKLKKEIRSLQRELCAKSIMMFAKTYFPHYCKFPFAKFHLELFKYLEEMTLNRSKKVAWAAPRGNAKSSIVSLIYPIWGACYGYEKIIAIMSNTVGQAETFLSNIKHEFSSNLALRRDFPDVCTPPNPRWKADEIITRNGVNIRISSVKRGVRGMRFKADRPTLIIVDDVESTDAVKTREGREKLYDWFTKVVLNLGSEKTNYVVVGTILHFDSLLAKLTSKEKDEFPGFDRAIYKSVVSWAKRQDLWDRCMRVYFGKDSHNDKTGPKAAKSYFKQNKKEMLDGAKVIWPEKEDYFNLMVLQEENSFSFASEKQNEPRDSGALSLDKNKVVWIEDKFKDRDELVRFIGHKLMILGAIDPSVGKNMRADYSAIITAFVDRATNTVYVVDADIGRWNLGTLVNHICIHHKTYKYATLLYEANAAQAWLGETIKKDFHNIPMKPITNTQSKEGRIAKLMLLIHQEKVKLSKKLTELNRQLLSYPNGAYDDGVDALAMLVDSVEDEVRLSADQIKEILTQIKYPGYDPDDGSTVIGTMSEDGNFIPMRNPLNMIRDKSKPRPKNKKKKARFDFEDFPNGI